MGAHLKEIKALGKELFTSREDCVGAVWRERPLPDALRSYATVDVTMLFHIYEEWCDAISDLQLKEISHQRALRRIQDRREVPDSEEGALREFPLPKDFKLVFIGGLSTRMSEQQLMAHFSQFGKIVDIK